MSTTRKLFANAAVAVGSSAALLLGVTGTANAEPCRSTADRCRAGTGPIGNGGAEPGDSEGSVRPVQRGVDADGRRRRVHRGLGGTGGLEEHGLSGHRLRRATGRRARARPWCGAGRRGSPARGRRPGPCRRTGPRGSCRSRSRSGARTRGGCPHRHLTAQRLRPRPRPIRSSVPTRRRRRISCIRRSATGA